jgi:hypothetical protein
MNCLFPEQVGQGCVGVKKTLMNRLIRVQFTIGGS